MKLEKLRNNRRKNVIIGLLLGLTITSSLILSISLAKFKKTESIPLAKGTINYSESDFSMMAIKISDDKTNYSDTNSVPTEGYTFNVEKSTCSVGGVEKDVSMDYKDGKVYVGINEKGTKCNLFFDKFPKAVSEILANLGSSIVEQTESVPNFANAATINEGVFKTSDGMYGGKTYYWRGAAEDNHLIFADMCWRIIRINGDGSIRLIYNGTPSGTSDNRTCTGNKYYSLSIIKNDQAYSSSDDYSYYVGWTYTDGLQRPTDNLIATPSNAKIQTDVWYQTNIIDNGLDDKVATGKFCNDRDIATGYSWAQQPNSMFYYSTVDRSGIKSGSSVAPVTTCPKGDVYEMKVGAITIDEVIMAGGALNRNNSTYYLFNGQKYLTMSPSYWFYSTSSARHAYVFYVNTDGGFWHYRATDKYGIRPVINLKSDIAVKSGIGTTGSPYVAE